MLKKLQGLKGALKDWNNNVCGNIQKQIATAEAQIHQLDLKSESQGL